jgi:predicted MFS family arabinose efflux permease
MHSNVRRLYALNLLAGIVFWYPIEKLFLLHIGVSPFGISINAVVFLVILVAFDVPAGVLADHWKRKYTLQTALICLVIASLIGAVSNSLAEYLPMTIFLGGFVVLTQGTFQAMMYDSLEDTNHQSSYDKHQGMSYAMFLAGLGISSVAGGYMAQTFGFRATYFATALIMVLAFGLACTLSEPKSHKLLADRKLKQHIQSSFRQIVATRLLLQLSFLITAVSVLRSAQNEYAGLLFVALGLSAIPIGWGTAAKWLFSALGQVVAPKIGRQALRLTPLFFITFTLFSLVHTRWSLLFFYIAGFLYSVVFNQAESAAQEVIPSEIRATTLSVLTFASNVVLVPLSLLFGWLAQRSVFNAYFAISVVGLLYLASWLAWGRKELRQVYHKQARATQLPSVEAEIA